MKKAARLLLVFIFLLVPVGAFSDSLTLGTEINSVSYGVSNFGFGLFPIGTNFGYNTSFVLVPSLTHKASFDIEFQFDVSSPSLSRYDYRTGQPWWSDGYTDDHEIGRNYFRIGSQFSTYIQQGFGINPVSGSGSMVNVRLAWFSRFTNASEPLSLSSDGPSNPVFTQPPFSTNEHLQAYPWLQGDGRAWNNHLTLGTYWYFRKGTVGPSTYDGLYFDVIFELGPWWLGNSILPDNVTSDFYKLSASASEYLTIFAVEQDNGWNWLNLMLGHSNSLGYTWGDVVPEHRIQTDRLRGYFTDSVYLRFTGPQFIASDCYPYFQVSLNNNLYFGGVQNDITGELWGLELRSSASFEVHLRLFGFIHVNYRFGYNFARGYGDFDSSGNISTRPGWWQNAQVSFYVSL